MRAGAKYLRDELTLTNKYQEVGGVTTGATQFSNACPARHVSVEAIYQQLRALEFAVVDVRQISHGEQIRLLCGAVVNVYDTGRVLVQGKLVESVREETLKLLRLVLPPTTKWMCK